VKVDASFAGVHFNRRADLAAAIAKVSKHIGLTSDSIVIASANGTFIDNAETTALSDICSNGMLYSPKHALGEGIGASALWQVIVGIQALKNGRLPSPVYHVGGERIAGSFTHSKHQITILACGLNQQVGAARLVLNSSASNVHPSA